MSAVKAAPAKKSTAKKAAAKKSAPARPSTRRARSESQWFEGVIGQEGAKRLLSFHLRNHLNNGAKMPNILLEGNKGDGKSYLARKFARNLPDPSDPTRQNKKFCPVDGSAVKNLTILFQDICGKFANGDDYVTVFIDEAHGLPLTVQNAFLTITEPNRSGITRYTFDDVEYIFDSKKVTWIFATTEADKIFEPLRDRLHIVQLREYEPDELAQIMELTIEGKVRFDGNTLEQLSHLVRRNARHADRLAEAVLALGVPTFKQSHLTILKSELSLLPHGLTDFELRLLETLNDEGEMSLGHLASRLGKPRKAVQFQLEPYVMALGYMEVEGKRRISGKGVQFLREYHGKSKKGK